jgi:HAD superfamily hydrolase (TIGR01509 family)
MTEHLRFGGVILDLDGTLIDSHEMWFAIMSDVAHEVGANPLDRRDFDRTFGQSTAADVAQFFPGADVHLVDSLYARLWSNHAHLLRPMPNAVELLAALLTRDIPVACATNSSAEFTRTALSAAGLDVRVFACADEVLHPKPAPDVIELAARRIGIPIARCVMVGDTPFDMDAARAAGCWSVGVDVSGDQTVDSLGALLRLWGL